MLQSPKPTGHRLQILVKFSFPHKKKEDQAENKSSTKLEKGASRSAGRLKDSQSLALGVGRGIGAS